jgi:PAS domain S-box/diguanylate cyclase (GGDEF) domain
MLQVLTCIAVEHDLRLVLLAAAICVLSCFAAVTLLRRASSSKGKAQAIWILTCGAAGGFGIWATHFIAMLAYSPGEGFFYEPIRTFVSLGIAIIAISASAASAVKMPGRQGEIAGGLLFGLGVTCMHFIGMSAVEFSGTIEWDRTLAISAVVLAIVAAIPAFNVAMSGGKRGRIIIAAAILVVSIVAMHFTAMSAVNVIPGPSADRWGNAIPSYVMIIVIVSVSLSLLLCGITASMFAVRAEAAVAAEQMNFKLLVQGVKDYAICMLDQNGRIMNWNAGAERMMGYEHEEAVGQDLSLFYTPNDRLAGLPEVDLETAAREGKFEDEGVRIRKDGSTFSANVLIETIMDEEGRRVGYAQIIKDISERIESEQKISFLVHHDNLTGLPNRGQYESVLDHAITTADKTGARVAAICIDLDRFKEVNDSYGHATGDVLLKELAKSMQDICTNGEFIARFGGDEFAAIKSFTDDAELEDFANRLLDTLTGRRDLQGLEVYTGASIGIAIYPTDATDRAKLLSDADMAMYRSKDSIEQKISFYEADMDEAARSRRALVRDIWKAIEDREFYLAYQEQRDARTEELSGYEVLIRWEHKERGNVPPDVFIPISEECGAILAIGDWVLHKACEDAAAWGNKYKIAVNLSPLQLNNLAFADRVKTIIETTGVDPAMLELEVTESAIIGDKERALTILTKIKELGVTIAIDDFGTGYSSLETLRSFPFDKIKLDRSFTNGLSTSNKSKAFVRAIVALGKSLDVAVLAEGVETKEQMDVLVEEGCDQVQGFYFGRPGRLDRTPSAEETPQAA